MPHRILKYRGHCNKAFVLRLPKDAVVLSVQNQLDVPVLWITVDSSVPMDQYVNRVFISFGTGQEIIGIEDFKYIATVQELHGRVWHFYEHLK